MKKLIFACALLVLSHLLAEGQNIFNTPSFTSKKDIVGHVVVPLKYDDTPYLDKFELAKPDTLWKKKVANPKLGKHYTLSTEFKDPFVGHRFRIIDYKKEYGRAEETVVFESLETGKVISFKSVVVSHLELFDLPEISARLTDEHKGKTYYGPDNEYTHAYLDDLKPFVVDSVSFQFSFGTEFIDDLTGTIVYGHYLDGKSCRLTSKYKGFSSITTEEDYVKRVRDAEMRKAHEGKYSFYLANVTKPTNLKVAKGRITEDNGVQSIYEDSFLRIAFAFTNSQFEFVLNNKSDNSMKINWDKALFIDEKNSSQRVIHKGVKYIDASKPQTPSVIARGSKIEELLVPADNVYYSSYSKEWHKKEIIPNYSLDGRYGPDTQMKIIIPIESNGKVYEYMFSFGVYFTYKNPDFREQYLKEHAE